MSDHFLHAQQELIANISHRNVGNWADGELDTFLDGKGIFETALCHAIHEMLWTGVEGAVGEETLTASLMGHLASSINWYAMMAHWAASEGHEARPSCDVYWAEQPRSVESVRGADFGMARRLDADRVRIALFQAKQQRSNGKADLYRRIGRRKNEEKPNIQEADASLRRMLINGRSDWNGKIAIHQVEKLVHWWRTGLTALDIQAVAGKADVSWCRYVFWPTSEDGGTPKPTVSSLPEVIDRLQRSMHLWSREPIERVEFKIRAGDHDFLEILCSGSEEDLIVDIDQARYLLHDLVKVGKANPLFVGVDDTGSGDSGFFHKMFPAPDYRTLRVAGTQMIKAAHVQHDDYRPPSPLKR